jgi:hypothetical protein
MVGICRIYFERISFAKQRLSVFRDCSFGVALSSDTRCDEALWGTASLSLHPAETGLRVKASIRSSYTWYVPALQTE